MADQRKVIDKGMIEEFGSISDTNNFRDVVYHLTDIMEDIVLELSKSNIYLNIKNIELLLSAIMQIILKFLIQKLIYF